MKGLHVLYFGALHLEIQVNIKFYKDFGALHHFTCSSTIMNHQISVLICGEESTGKNLRTKNLLESAGNSTIFELGRLTVYDKLKIQSERHQTF